MLFDTDVLIWVQKRNSKAIDLVDNATSRYISLQTYMELFQCARNKNEHKIIRDFLQDFNFIVLPFTELIGHRAAIYIEEYTLSCGLRAGDAIIAATALEENLVLCTSNSKHFKDIKDIQLHILKPAI